MSYLKQRKGVGSWQSSFFHSRDWPSGCDVASTLRKRPHFSHKTREMGHPLWLRDMLFKPKK